MDAIGPDLVDAWRIDSVWTCGGSMNRCMHGESDALVMARVAMGEAPGSLSDRVYVMWSIKLRAALGFKEALPGWRAPDDHWGPETGIQVEALCNGGCQYTPVRAADGIYFGCLLSEHHALRAMLCPTDEQLQDFAWTVAFAEAIAEAPLTDMPEEMRGYESFRSPQVTWHGQRNREGGLLSRQFFLGGNIWRDEYPQDNLWWERADGRAAEMRVEELATPRPTRTPTPSASPTLRPSPTSATLAAPSRGDELPETNQEEAIGDGQGIGAIVALAIPALIIVMWTVLEARRSPGRKPK